MDGPSRRDPLRTSASTPADLLDALRAHPEWADRERDAVLDRVVSGFPEVAVVTAVRDRLDDLSGRDAEALLRLVEAFPRPELLRALGSALAAQPDLPPERAWEALAVLDGAGVLPEFPELAGRWEELNELLDDEGSVEQLVAQIEGDPDGVWLALQGLGAVEPEVRAEIISGLAGRTEPVGPRLSEFLRLLAYAHDPSTRAAALDALAADPHPAGPSGAWLDLARHHPDPEVAAAARRGGARPGGGPPPPRRPVRGVARPGPAPPRPRGRRRGAAARLPHRRVGTGPAGAPDPLPTRTVARDGDRRPRPGVDRPERPGR